MLPLVAVAAALLPQPHLLAPRPQPRASRALMLRGGSGLGVVAAIGTAYSSALTAHPIVTKSLTASAIFALSDQVRAEAEKNSPALVLAASGR